MTSRSPELESLWAWLPDLPRAASDADIAKAALQRILEFRTEAKLAHEFMVERGHFGSYLEWKRDADKLRKK